MDHIRAVQLAENQIAPAYDDEQREAWQHIYTSGLHQTLPGWFGRMVSKLLAEGEIA